jgi:hypothetical protein
MEVCCVHVTSSTRYFLFTFLNVWAPKVDVQHPGFLTFTVSLYLDYDLYPATFPWL